MAKDSTAPEGAQIRWVPRRFHRLSEEAQRRIRNLRFEGIERFCVMFMVNGKERHSPWFSSRERAHFVRKMMVAKYGDAVVYVD